MSDKSTIAVDIDEVLMPHFQDLITWYNQRYRTKLTLANNHPKDVKGWGTTSFEEAVKRVQTYLKTERFEYSQPFEEAKVAVRKLSRDHKMIIVTSRDTIIEETTRRWLDHHFPELFKEAHFTAMYSLGGLASKSKASVAKQIGADYMIDDSFDHILAASKEGIKGLLFGDYPWNRGVKLPRNVVRVKGWQEVLEYFEREQGR